MKNLFILYLLYIYGTFTIRSQVTSKSTRKQVDLWGKCLKTRFLYALSGSAIMMGRVSAARQNQTVRNRDCVKYKGRKPRLHMRNMIKGTIKGTIKSTVGAAAIAVLLTACAGNTDLQATNEKKVPDTGTAADASAHEKTYEGLLPVPVSCQQKNAYDTLNVATYITRVDGTYFMADCYHDQILYHDNITDPPDQWDVLTNEVHYAHTVASDGTMFVVDDTENNRLMVFQKMTTEEGYVHNTEGYVHTQTLENIGMRPHYVQYDEKKQVFMAWSSITGEMYMVKRAGKPEPDGVYPLYVDRILKIDELYGVYVRSFTIMEDGIYFVSGHNNQKIIKAAINSTGDGFDIIAEYGVADEIAGMVQLTKVGGYYYITVSTDNRENQDFATIIRTDNLENLAGGVYEDIYSQFGVSGGTPYYITQIDDRYYMAHHRTSENIIVFEIRDDQIQNVEVIY